MRIIIHILASFFVFLLSFRLGLQFHLPIETIQKHLIWNLQQNSNWSVDIQNVELYSLMSLKAKNVSVIQREQKNAEYEEFLFVEELLISPSIPSLLSGQLSTGIETSLLTGTMTAKIEQQNSERFVGQLVGNDLDLSLLPAKGKDWQANLMGKLQFALDLDHHLTDLNEGFGTFSLHIDAFQIEDLEVLGFSLIPLQFSETVIEMERDGNKLNMKNGRLIGEQIEAEITGFIRLNNRLERSRLQLKVFVKFNPELELMVKPFLRDALQDDGSYLINIGGTLIQPNFQQKTRENRSKNINTSNKNKESNKIDPENFDDPIESEDQQDDIDTKEAQRQKRLERQKKRMEERQRRMQNSPKITPNQQKVTPRDIPIRSNIGNNIDMDGTIDEDSVEEPSEEEIIEVIEEPSEEEIIEEPSEEEIIEEPSDE